MLLSESLSSRILSVHEFSYIPVRDLIPAPCDLLLHFGILKPVINLHAKFEIYSYSRLRDMDGSQDSKIGHVNQFSPL